MALDVRPSLASLDARNNVLTNAVIVRNRFLNPRVLANCLYLFFGKFRHWATFTFVASAYFYCVLHVSRSRVPTQIFQSIVSPVRIVVAAIKRSIFWTFESRKNQPMHWMFFMARGCFAKHDVKIPMASGKWLKWLALKTLWAAGVMPNYSVIAANVAKIRNRVKPFVAWDLFPYFHANPLSGYGFNYNIKGTYNGS